MNSFSELFNGSFTEQTYISYIQFLLGLDLPRDYRALLSTPRSVEIKKVAGGELWYNGIASNLMTIFSKLSHDITISLTFNMDGLPLFKSSQTCFCPILGLIHGAYLYNHKHFMIQNHMKCNVYIFYIRYAGSPSNDNINLVWIHK